MVDTVTGTERSRIMRLVRGEGNKSTEALLSRLFRKAGVTGWRRHLPMLGRPDFVFRQERLIVFVDGCFWHGCPRHLRLPSSNRPYWAGKIGRNVQRDARIRRALRRDGWRVARVWEHDLAAPSAQRRSLDRMIRLLARND